MGVRERGGRAEREEREGGGVKLVKYKEKIQGKKCLTAKWGDNQQEHW